MHNKYVLGIDTSNYTTSVCLLNLEGECVLNKKQLLSVREGECGLRQSDAVFAHTKNLPPMLEELRQRCADGDIVAVGVSTRPRNVDGSYMPCFLSGVSVASGIACASNVPLYSFSHQCGHLMAAIYSSGRFDLLSAPFCAFHVSGGTTEMLRISSYDKDGFQCDLIGGTLDSSAGQIIDRVGVRMGLPFPAGVHMERVALAFCDKIPNRKPTVKGTYVNLSGLENLANKLYDESRDAAKTASFVFKYIARALEEMTRAYIDTYGADPILYAGGVMSCSMIKDYLRDKFDASFAEPHLSSDNALGIAELTRRKYLAEN